MSFDNAIAEMKKQNDASDPVRAAQRELAPVREAAVQSLKAFDAVVEKLLPVFEDATRKLHAAASVGVAHPNLQWQLTQAHEMMAGGRNNFRTLIERIENLTAHDLGQDAYFVVRMGGALRAARASIDALPGLAKGVTTLVAELERVLAQHVPAQAPIMTVNPPRGITGVTVEATFDPRR